MKIFVTRQPQTATNSFFLKSRTIVKLMEKVMISVNIRAGWNVPIIETVCWNGTLFIVVLI